MNYIRFEWDVIKDRANFKKHKISFDEAKTVFYDENARLISDPNPQMVKIDLFSLV